MNTLILETIIARPTKCVVNMCYYCTQLNAPSAPVNQQKPSSKRNFNAEQFIFGKHNNYRLFNDYLKFDSDWIINREVIQEIIISKWLPNRLSEVCNSKYAKLRNYI